MDPTTAGIVAFLAWLVADGGAVAAAAVYDWIALRLHAYFRDARVRGYVVPLLTAALVAAAGQALIPAEAVAGASYAPLVDAALPFVLGLAGALGARWQLTQAEVSR